MTYFSTVSGLVYPAWAALLDAMKARFRAAYGDDIRVDDPDGGMGRMARIIAERTSDILSDLGATVACLLPSTSNGAILDELVKFNGITRNVATNTTGQVTIYSNDYSLSLPPSGALCGTESGDEFNISGPVNIGPNSNTTVSVACTVEGAVQALAGTVTKIVTPYRGWESVTNALDFTPGDSRESDPNLRARRWAAALAVGLHHPSMIKKVLGDLTGVTEVFVDVNNGSVTSDSGVPPGNVRAILIGGTDQDIADTLFGIHPLGDAYPRGAGSIAGGIGSFGSNFAVSTDPETSQSETMYFDRGIQIPIYITVNTVKLPTYPVDGDDQIKDAIVSFFDGDLEIDDVTVEPFHLGDDVVSSRIYTPCNKVSGHRVREVLISRTPGPNSQADIPMLNHELAVTDADKIYINGI